MKGIFALGLTILLAGAQAHSQNIDSAVARNFTQMAKDSLALNGKKAEQAFNIEMMILTEKRKIREKYRNTPQLQPLMQEQDNRRDSLYRILVGEEKYSAYKRQKQKFNTGKE